MPATTTYRPAKGTPFSLQNMSSELWLASLHTIALRGQLLTGPLGPVDQIVEWQRMIDENMSAGGEMYLAVQQAGFDWWAGTFNPWAASQAMMKPLHYRATRRLQRSTSPANALRLARGRR